MALFSTIEEIIKGLNTSSISQARQKDLQPLVTYIQEKLDQGSPVRINFICTHNSRRSHLSQVWAQALAHHYGLQQVTCYSGGTEATALFPKAAETLTDAGFQVVPLSEGKNPVYSIKYSDHAHPVIGFSKRMDDAFNPTSGFAAIMTCSQADEGCPFVPGAEKRIPITFEDPKAFDGTSQQADKYRERSLEIATALKYVFAQIKA